MKLIKLNAIDSTNDYLKALSRDVDLEDEVMVVALAQTLGRGQVGAKWHSEAGKSLTFSMFKRFKELAIDHQFAINCAVSLGIKKALSQVGIDHLKIKWPNDILADGKKLCGILIENQLQGNTIVSSIIGVGINVNNRVFPNLPRATSMALTSGKEHDPEAVLGLITSCISSEMQRLGNNDLDALKLDYERDLFRKNIIAVFETKLGNRCNGIIQGISGNGELCLKLEDESLQFFKLKELQLLY